MKHVGNKVTVFRILIGNRFMGRSERMDLLELLVQCVRAYFSGLQSHLLPTRLSIELSRYFKTHSIVTYAEQLVQLVMILTSL